MEAFWLLCKCCSANVVAAGGNTSDLLHLTENTLWNTKTRLSECSVGVFFSTIFTVYDRKQLIFSQLAAAICLLIIRKCNLHSDVEVKV